MTRSLAAALVIGALNFSAGRLDAQERFSLKGDRGSIHNLVGELTVTAGRGPDIAVEITRGGADASDLRIERRTVGGAPALVVDYPEDEIVYPRLGLLSRSQFDLAGDGTFGEGLLRLQLNEDGFSGNRTSIRGGRRIRVTSGGRGLEAWADIRVEVPAGKTIAVHLGTGRINISNVNGHVRARAASGSIAVTGVTGSSWIESGSGSVRADNLAGHTSIRTGSGSINVSDIRAQRLDVSTGSGSIEGAGLTGAGIELRTGSGSVRLSRVTSEALRASTGSGGITVNRLSVRDLSLDTGSGSISGELLSDVRNASLETGSGGVTLAVPKQLGAEIRIDTGSGGISTDVPLQLIEKRRSHLRGTLGDGDGRIEISTGSGSVRLRQSM